MSSYMSSWTDIIEDTIIIDIIMNIIIDIRLEANSGMYIFHTFFYRLDAKKLQMY